MVRPEGDGGEGGGIVPLGGRACPLAAAPLHHPSPSSLRAHTRLLLSLALTTHPPRRASTTSAAPSSDHASTHEPRRRHPLHKWRRRFSERLRGGAWVSEGRHAGRAGIDGGGRIVQHWVPPRASCPASRASPLACSPAHPHAMRPLHPSTPPPCPSLAPLVRRSDGRNAADPSSPAHRDRAGPRAHA